jgi:hypothetical protein
MNTKSKRLFTHLSFVVSIILAIAALSAEAQNIVRNGSFESTDGYGQPYYWSPVSMNLGWPNAPDGVNYTYIGSVSQTLSTTAGQSYQLSFYAAGDLYASQTSTVEVDWGGKTAADFMTEPHQYNPQVNRYLQIVWQEFSTTVEASSSSTVLTFQSMNNTYLLLDDVQAVPIPEPSALSLLVFGVSWLITGGHLRLPKRSPCLR